jgi:hypothetical protein
MFVQKQFFASMSTIGISSSGLVMFEQGTEVEGSIQLTSSLRLLVLKGILNNTLNIKMT